MANRNYFRFLSRRPLQIVTVILLFQAFLSYSFTRDENIPAVPTLSQFPENVGDWVIEQDGVMDKEAQSIIKPDDYLIRSYVENGTKSSATLFVAYFKSQRSDKAPHSPKNCLPGSGWVPSSAGMIDLPVPGASQPIRVNRYVVAKGNEKNVVLYWYQTWNRVIASEYMARLYLISDSMRYNRSDTALVRIISPVAEGQEASAVEVPIRFAQALYPLLEPYFPQAENER